MPKKINWKSLTKKIKTELPDWKVVLKEFQISMWRGKTATETIVITPYTYSYSDSQGISINTSIHLPSLWASLTQQDWPSSEKEVYTSVSCVSAQKFSQDISNHILRSIIRTRGLAYNRLLKIVTLGY